VSGYVTLKPRFELLEVLSSIAAYQDSKFVGKGKRWGRAGSWCIVRQPVIIAWYQAFLRRFGFPDATMCRRTLNYQVAGLKRRGYLHAETQRHQRHQAGRRAGELDLRPSIYKFTSRGQLWIKRRMGWVANLVAPSAVQRIAQSGFNPDLNSSNSLSSAVDKTPTARGGKTAKLRRRTSSGTAGAMRRPGKALVRKGPPGRARKAPARRSRQAPGPRTQRRRRRSKRA